MSDAQNLAYATVQILHNFGAVAAVGGSVSAMLASPKDRRKPAWIAFAGWVTQAVSGPAFGMLSFYFYHRFPDIAGIAVAALTIKIVCAVLGFLLVTAYILPRPRCRERFETLVWPASTALAATALTAAAVLRWFA